MTDDEQTRDDIEEIVNDEPPVQEPVQETIIETMLEEVKPVPKANSKAKATPTIKITKETVEPVESVEPVEPEPIVEEQHKNDRLKEHANSPDCNMLMSQHTLKHIHKKKRVL